MGCVSAKRQNKVESIIASRGEKIMLKRRTEHRKGYSSVTGIIYFTDQRIYFLGDCCCVQYLEIKRSQIIKNQIQQSFNYNIKYCHSYMVLTIKEEHRFPDHFIANELSKIINFIQ